MKSVCERVPLSLYLLTNSPVANVDKVPCDCRCRSHLRAHQVCASASSLAAFEVAVAGGGTTFARRKNIGIHAQAHGAAGLAPVEAGLAKHLVQPLRFTLCLHSLRPQDRRVGR